MITYRIVRFYAGNNPREIVDTGLTLAAAREHCTDPETSSSTAKGSKATDRTEKFGPWFEGYEEE